MKTKMTTGIVLALFLASTFHMAFDTALVAADGDPYPWLDETGTHFELDNSDYINASITSDTPVHVMLCASSGVVDYLIESASEATCTELALGNLEPSTTYYMYEDSYLNDEVFTTDSNGRHTYTQDLSQIHHIFIQKDSGTIYINADTTLQSDVYDNVEIIADNIVLDLNGYSIIGTVGFGIYLSGRNNVVIKNGGVQNFFQGIMLYGGSGNVINCVNVSSTDWAGINIFASDNNLVDSSYVAGTSWFAIELLGSNGNTLRNNRITNNNHGCYLGYGAGANVIYHNNVINNTHQVTVTSPYPNVWDDGYPSGGNYWSNYAGEDADCDGIGDTPYVIDANNRDRYPYMEESGWRTPKEMLEDEILIIESWDLNGGHERSITAKLEDALRLLEKGNTNGAKRKLGDLIKKVENDAFHLSQEQKNYIIQTTQEIIDHIG